MAVICRLLGVPIEDEPQFSGRQRCWRKASIRSSRSPATRRTGWTTPEAAVWLRQYLSDLVAAPAIPREDLISALIAAEEDGDQLTGEEIVATCNLLLIAGHETTVNLIANAVLAMVRQPALWTALSADPSRAGAIAEETLRYDPPVQLTSRMAGADMEIGGLRGRRKATS